MGISTEMACFVGRILGCIAFGVWLAKREELSENVANATGYVKGFNDGVAARAGMEETK